MAPHYFHTLDDLRAFWRDRHGYLFNRTSKLLHKTCCPTYRYSSSHAPSPDSHKQGFDTPEDVLQYLGGQGRNRWESCPVCNPDKSINAVLDASAATGVEEKAAPPSEASVTHPTRPSGDTSAPNSEDVIDIICEFGRSVPRFTTGLAAADELVYSDGFAFLMACCLDRGMPSEIIWKIPYYLKLELGHLNPVRFAQMSIEEIQQALARLPVRPRYTNEAPYTIFQLAQIISSEFGGRSEALWELHSPREIISTLRRIRGVDTIANMTVNLLHCYLGVKFSVDDLHDIDVKPDVHVERVFQRTGLMDRAGRSVQVARQLREAYPAALDLGSWEIGRRWCHASNPDHGSCLLSAICPRKDAS